MVQIMIRSCINLETKAWFLPDVQMLRVFKYLQVISTLLHSLAELSRLMICTKMPVWNPLTFLVWCLFAVALQAVSLCPGFPHL